MNINNSLITYLLFLSIAYLSGCATSLPETASIPPATPRHSALASDDLNSKLESSKEIITAKKTVVEIYNKSGNSGGTGFIIEVLHNRVYILTVAHLIEGNSQPKVNIFSQGDSNARVLRVDEPHNLALLVVENEDFSDTPVPYYLPKNNDLTTAENTIFTIGFPKEGKLWAYQKLSYVGTQNEHLLFTGDLIEEGNSGGPVISVNKILGMIAGKSEKVYAISPGVIRSFLQSIGTEGSAILAKHDKRQSAAVVATQEKAINPPLRPANKSAIQTTTVAGKAVKPPVKVVDKIAKTSGIGVVTPASSKPPVASQGKDRGSMPVTLSDKKAGKAPGTGVVTPVSTMPPVAPPGKDIGATPVTSSAKTVVVATQEKAKVVTPKAKPSESVKQVIKESVTPSVTATTPKSVPATPLVAASPPKTTTATTGTPTTSKSVTPLAKPSESTTQITKEAVTSPITATTPKAAPATQPATAASPPKMATVTTGTLSPTDAKSITPLAKPSESTTQITKEAVTSPITATTPKAAPATQPATAASPPKMATATTGTTMPMTSSKSVTPSAKQPDPAQVKQTPVATTKSSKETIKAPVTAKSQEPVKAPVTAKSKVVLKTPMTTNAPQTKASVTGTPGNSLPETPPKPSPQPTEQAEPKTETASLNAMCTAIVADNMDSFRKEAKLLKKDSNLSYLASNVIQALALQDRKTVLEHSLKFLFEAFLLSHDAKDSTCSPLLLKLKADELDALKRAPKKK